MKFVIRLFMWAIAPLQFGGGDGGDGGAGEARKQEEERQARIKHAVDKINSIFDSTPVTTGANVATAYDPGATYYDAEGNVWVAPTKTVQRQVQGGFRYGGDGGNNQRLVSEQQTDMDAVNEAIKGGHLFTARQTITPAKSRDQLYAEHKDAVYDMNKRDIDKQYTEAERQNRFGLARSGLMGGSVDVDSNAQLQDKTNQGLMRATGIADQAAADLKTQDERTRQSLISMAQSGIDTGTAQQMALRGLDANAQSAAGARQGATVGNLFSDLSQAYLMRQYGNGMRAGTQQGGQWYGVSSPQQKYAGT